MAPATNPPEVAAMTTATIGIRYSAVISSRSLFLFDILHAQSVRPRRAFLRGYQWICKNISSSCCTHITNVRWKQVVNASTLSIHHNTHAKVAKPSPHAGTQTRMVILISVARPTGKVAKNRL